VLLPPALPPRTGKTVIAGHSVDRTGLCSVFPIRRSALAFVDEAHHAMTPRRVEALDEALDPSAVRVALTATPDYDSDRRRFEGALRTASGRDGAPVEPSPSTLRALAGPYEPQLGPEEVWIRREALWRLQRNVCRLPPRPQHAVVVSRRLVGPGPTIGPRSGRPPVDLLHEPRHGSPPARARVLAQRGEALPLHGPPDGW